MLKLNASYSKKVPADGEYTSQSYHASIEVELPDGLSAEQLNGKHRRTESPDQKQRNCQKENRRVCRSCAVHGCPLV